MEHLWSRAGANPDVIESGGPLRPMLALGQLFPRTAERTMRRIGATEIFRRAAELNERA